MKEININLRDPIEYDLKGEKREGSFVSLLPPKTKHIGMTSVLKQAFQIAAMEVSKDRDEKEDKEDGDGDEIKPSEAVALVYAGGDSIDIQKVMLTAVALLTSGLVLVDGEQKLTKPLCELLSQEDFEEILGTFLVNFIAASLLRNLSSK